MRHYCIKNFVLKPLSSLYLINLCMLILIKLFELTTSFYLYIYNNKKTPEGVYAGCVAVIKNYWYVEWQWKVE